jgi:hypothetical protein
VKFIEDGCEPPPIREGVVLSFVVGVEGDPASACGRVEAIGCGIWRQDSDHVTRYSRGEVKVIRVEPLDIINEVDWDSEAVSILRWL